MKKGKRRLLIWMLCLIVTLVNASSMGLQVSANELKQVNYAVDDDFSDGMDNAEAVRNTLSEDEAEDDNLTKGEDSIGENDSSEKKSDEGSAEDETEGEDCPLDESDIINEEDATDDSIQGEEEATDPIENEVEKLDAVLEKANGDIASGSYKNEEDGSDIKWNIDANGKLTVTGTGNFRENADMPPSEMSNWGWYPWLLYTDYIKSAEIKVTGTTNATHMFWGCSNMSDVNLSAFDTSEVTDMSFMFSGCSGLSNLDVSHFDTSKVTDMSVMFSGCSSLGDIDLSHFDTGNVTDMEGMFSGCSSLGGIDLSHFDTGNVTDMIYMFSECSSLKELDLSCFDTSKVTNMQGMFSECRKLEELNLSNFNTGNVTCMAYMVKNCDSLVNLNLKSFNTKNLVIIDEMFSNCKTLISLDLSNFDLSNMRHDDAYLFEGCEALTTIHTPYNIRKSVLLPFFEKYMWCDPAGNIITELPQYESKSIMVTREAADPEKNIASGEYKENGSNITWRIDANRKLIVEGMGEFAEFAKDSKDKWRRAPWYSKRLFIKSAEINVSNMTDASYMFHDCDKLSSIDVSNFNTSQVTNMQGMFQGCGSLKELDLSSFDTDNVTDMSEMFSMVDSTGEMDSEKSHVGPVNINISSFKTKKVTNMFEMFMGCGDLTSLDVSNFDTDNVTNMSSMFEFCSSLTKLDVSSFHTNRVTDMSYMFGSCIELKSLDLSNFDTGNVTDMHGMFSGCSSLTSLNICNFNTSNVTNMRYMFAQNQLTSLDVSGFDTIKVTDMSFMFENCRKLTSLDVSNFDTRNVKNMSNMFFDCGQKQIQLDVSHFDTGHVTDMTSMFQSCSASNLDVSNFDTSNVKYMPWMFASSSLESVNVSGLNTGKVENMSYIFQGCNKLTELDLSSFDLAEATMMTGMFEFCKTLNKIDSPMNLKQAIELPKKYEDDIWHDESGKEYTELPLNLAYSITLYKESNSGSGDTDKQVVSISGISIEDKIYNSKPNPYTGTAVVTDSSGKQIQGVSLAYSYSGTLADGSVYAETADAPSQAGNYMLSFQVTGTDAEQYTLNQSSYSFRIVCKDVTITAESIEIGVGGQLPKVSELRYTVDGLIENDELIKEPSLRYSEDNISTAKEGKYGIIPYDADAGNNYNIKYVQGTLIVGNSSEDPGQGDILGGDDEDKAPNGLWVSGLAEGGYAYTGKAIKPAVRVYDHKMLLTEKKDYTVSYTRNTKAYGYASTDRGFDANIAPTITVKAKGNYSGKETLTFKILPPDIGSDDFAADDMMVAYKANGVQKPVPVLIWKDKKLKNKTDYTVAYYDSNGNKIDSVKTVGKYDVELSGRGNFGGTRRIELTVTDSLKLMDKVSVSGMKSQPYKGSAITPAPMVKDGGTTLREGVHYTVSYSQNTEVGTAYAVIKGIEATGYGGSKRVSFKIAGTPINKAAVTGLSGQQFFYMGTDITPQIRLNITAEGSVSTLSPETDYTVTWQKNRDAGTATAIFTGKGAYTGTMKKTFKIGKFDIAANAGGRFTAELEQQTVPYAKGGAKPRVVVKFKKRDGSLQTLVEGQDYTLSCRNHTAVNDGSRANAQPTVTVKGKGNFSGTFDTVLNFKITAQDIGQLTLTAQDKTYQNKKNIYVTKVTVTDLNGKALKAGADYNKNFTYTYKNDTAVMNVADYGMTVRAAGDVVDNNDIIPAGTVLVVRADARDGSNYTGLITGEYRITQMSISSASVSIPKQNYTGQEITLDKSQITVKMKGNLVDTSQYEIVQSSYKNNVKKGTASVTIRGAGNYGGTKTVKFSIGTKGFSWWWRRS